MSEDLPTGARRPPLRIEGPMTIYEAPAQKPQILQALAASEAPVIEIDLGAVDEIDTAGLQLLLLARREARKAGKSLALVAIGAAAQEVLERYRLHGAPAQWPGSLDGDATQQGAPHE